MKIKVLGSSLVFLFLCILWLLCRTDTREYTCLELTESGTGRRIYGAVLQDGEEVLLTWKNSLYKLDVIEVFQARRGLLILDQVTFANPQGYPPPVVKPAELEDYYHTGGPFSVRGLAKPFTRVIHRVGEIGNPRFKIRNRWVTLKEEVGFGGGVVLTTTRAGFFGTVFAVLYGS